MVKIQTIEKLFYFILVYSYLLLPLLFLFNISRKKEAILIAVYGFLFFGLLNIYKHLPTKDLRILYLSLYTFLEYSFFATLIGISIRNKNFRWVIVILSFLFLVFQVTYYLTADFKRLDSIPIGIETILILIYVAYYFYHFFKVRTDRYIYQEPSFWMIVGILIYLGGTFFFNILVNHVERKQYEDFWYLTYIPDILKNMLLAFCIFLYTRSFKKESKKSNSKLPYLDMI